MPERVILDIDILIHLSDHDGLENELLLHDCSKFGAFTIGISSWQLDDDSILDVIESSAVWVSGALAQPHIGIDNMPNIQLPYFVFMKLISNRTQDLADISRMMGRANDHELDQVRTLVNLLTSSDAADLESLIALGKLERHQK